MNKVIKADIYFDGEYYRAELAGKVINIVGELDKTKFLRLARK